MPVSSSHSPRCQPTARVVSRPLLDAKKRRHDLDVEREGALEPRIVDDAREAGGKAGSSWVSTVSGVSGRSKLAEHRFDHHAGRAVALDDGNETVGDVGMGIAA